MSNVYSKNKKELAGVRVVPAKTVWSKNRNGTYSLRKDIDIVGKVELPMPNFILKANNTGRQTSYVDDVSALPSRTKKDLVSHFYDKSGKRNKNSVAYLVRTDSKAKK